MDHVITIALDSLPLAIGTGAGGRVESFAVNGAALVQEYQPVRAASVAFADRYGKSNDLAFTITTEHADMVDALAFIGARRGAVPGVGALAVTLTIGGKVVTISALRAKWGGVQGACTGRTSRVQYSVKTGLLTVAVTGAETVGPGDFWLPSEPTALLSPLTVPAGQTGTIYAGTTTFAYSAQIDGTLNIEAGGILRLVP